MGDSAVTEESGVVVKRRGRKYYVPLVSQLDEQSGERRYSISVIDYTDSPGAGTLMWAVLDMDASDEPEKQHERIISALRKGGIRALREVQISGLEGDRYGRESDEG